MLEFYRSQLSTPIGIIEIKADNRFIYSISFLEQENETKYKENVLSIEAKNQLQTYFNSVNNTFQLPLCFQGSDFQHKVWKQLQHIPYGKTISYLELAQQLMDEKCIRAAASANGKNPFAIVIPCHRVIGKDGSLTGYASGLWRKKWLLEHENAIGKQVTIF
ncbi:MAG TPA: methylated-DNA--[protein]-cysteine S-methyltransferase [Chitinophagales bacterium]|jgi:methylated-DNA-[protein]-cysteine S-methyltransferase|nr:methylated-DNA--[protein]-cysteine S-methyltransferase [Chitinophagales bacterium]HQV78812.1 methylated-DNA--[protein]-cysteine S-methyltransferase [Chitinophagales bacterium]HQW79178.1 methylated-DNA--[protein]-cysteine S-methyltransferase [Chitinophagales bacterium]HRB18513.1 methylated-DNA--[protein]-cysteine S-methyltransferase [Chitinophagales bacterium]HRB67967.1 methylated-DNA--[protein]-cysteine S-methyltransferase [Chitinophagales bacterium]